MASWHAPCWVSTGKERRIERKNHVCALKAIPCCAPNLGIERILLEFLKNPKREVSKIADADSNSSKISVEIGAGGGLVG